MLGMSQNTFEVYTLPTGISHRIVPQIDLDTKLLRLPEISSLQWKQLEKLQRKSSAWYLKLRYGSPDTYLLLAYSQENLIHTEWIVPAKKMKPRYPFISDNSFSIISCYTSEAFRGMKIYPSQIQKIMEGNIPTNVFWIWAETENIASLNGIRKAGGVKAGNFVQTKRFGGIISQVTYFPERKDQIE